MLEFNPHCEELWERKIIPTILDMGGLLEVIRIREGQGDF